MMMSKTGCPADRRIDYDAAAAAAVVHHARKRKIDRRRREKRRIFDWSFLTFAKPNSEVVENPFENPEVGSPPDRLETRCCVRCSGRSGSLDRPGSSGRSDR